MKSGTHDSSPTSHKRTRRSCTDYKVACLVPLGIELAPLRAMLGEIHDDLPTRRDQNAYVLGAIAEHNVVIATLPSIGNNDSGVVANQLLNDFPAVRFGLLVGIAGGLPGAEGQNDIRLGDVVVSVPDGMAGGVIQFDKGKRNENNNFAVAGHLNKPTAFLRATVNKLKARHFHEGNRLHYLITDMIRRNPGMQDKFRSPGPENDHLYESDYVHMDGNTCNNCDLSRTIDRPKRSSSSIEVHYGTIGSSNAVIKNAVDRDKLGREHNLLAIEMEAAGIMDTLPCLVIRGICDYADSHKNKIWQPYASAAAAAYASEFLHVVPMDTVAGSGHKTAHYGPVSSRLREGSKAPRIEVDAGDASKSTLDALMKSLSFDSMGHRIRNVAEALPKTCDWLFEHDQFRVWTLREQIDEHNGFLWLKGKPGSGKSTLMKLALRWAKKKWPREVNVSYFFNARASSELDKSSLGFYRSLCYDLLSAYSQLQKPFLERFKTKEKDDMITTWTTLELKGFLAEAIQDLDGLPLNVFVDALDEGDENDVRQLVSFLEDLSLTVRSASIPLRICLSSRHYPSISIRSGLYLVVEDQKGHQDDLKHYINTKLVFNKSAAMEELQIQIYKKSAGIFLWLVLVVPILNKAFDKGRSIADMTQCLEDTPEELDDLFTQILDQSTEYMAECLSLLQWTLYAKRALTPTELDLAIQGSLVQTLYYKPTSMDSLGRYILNTSRGLVEITKTEPPSVQFIHETVREFLKGYGLTYLDSTLADNVEGKSHDRLKSSCMQYLSDHVHSLSVVTPETRRTDIAGGVPGAEGQNDIRQKSNYLYNIHVKGHINTLFQCPLSIRGSSSASAK